MFQRRKLITGTELVDTLSTLVFAEVSGEAGECVDMRREAPEPWATAMRKAGAVDPRNDNPSMSALAKMADLHTSTVASLIFRERETEPAVIERVASALGIDVREVSTWAGVARSVSDPYVAPPEANLLTARQRKALTEMIRAFAETNIHATQADHDLAAHKGEPHMPTGDDRA